MKRRSVMMLGGLFSSAAFAGNRSVPHSLPGGFLGNPPVARTRVGSVSTTKIGGTLSVPIPKPHLLYMMPHTSAVQVFQETGDVSVNAVGQITINTAGLWRVTACADWPGQYGTDVNNRKLTIWRAPVGVAPPTYAGGALTQYIDDNTSDRLASHDAPASDVPQYLRTSAPFAGGPLKENKSLTVRIGLPSGTPVAINPGDFVDVAIDSLTDAALGTSANNALRVDARVVGPNLVMVKVTNESKNVVQVPPGTAYVVAATSQAITGNSADAWTTLATSDEYLLQGESIFVTWVSETPGDFIQCTNMTYLQLELLKTPA